MQIEVGKFYRTRDGRKVGPMRSWSHYFKSDSYSAIVGGSQLWEPDGSVYECHPGEENDTLIAEWVDGPVVTETVTKTRIVPGTYDGVVVIGMPRSSPDRVEIGLEGTLLTADELDAAAAVLSALAKGLRDAG